jgi:hypothetical protein
MSTEQKLRTSSLFVGADMFAKGPNVPLDELDQGHLASVRSVTDIPALVAHERAQSTAAHLVRDEGFNPVCMGPLYRTELQNISLSESARKLLHQVGSR